MNRPVRLRRIGVTRSRERCYFIQIVEWCGEDSCLHLRDFRLVSLAIVYSSLSTVMQPKPAAS